MGCAETTIWALRRDDEVEKSALKKAGRLGELFGLRLAIIRSYIKCSQSCQ